jgi:hypothetical protein
MSKITKSQKLQSFIQNNKIFNQLLYKSKILKNQHLPQQEDFTTRDLINK